MDESSEVSKSHRFDMSHLLLKPKIQESLFEHMCWLTSSFEIILIHLLLDDQNIHTETLLPRRFWFSSKEALYIMSE